MRAKPKTKVIGIRIDISTLNQLRLHGVDITELMRATIESFKFRHDCPVCGTRLESRRKPMKGRKNEKEKDDAQF